MSLLRAAVAGAAAALLVTGCDGGSSEPADAASEAAQPLDDAAGTEDGDAELDGGDDGAAGSIDGPVVTASYAGTQWTVLATRVTDEPPDADGADDATYVYVDVEVASTLEDTHLRFPRDLFVLRHEAGEVSRSLGLLTDGLDTSVEVEPGEVRTGEVVFRLESENVEPADLTLRIEESGKVPAVLPLAGDPPPPPHPADVGISGDRETVTSTDPRALDVDVEPLGASVGLDRGSRRSDDGTFFVFVELRAHGLTAAGGGTAIDGDLLRLEVDGVPRGPDGVDGTGVLREGEAVDLQAVFSVPQDVGELTLLVGAPDGDRASYPLSLGP